MWFRKFFAATALLGCVLSATPAMASVHAGDDLIVTVFDHPELSGPISVDSTYHISMPLVGAVDVHGLDTNEIASRVQSLLSRYLVYPAVNVQLKTQLPVVFISGGPGGTLVYEPGETLVAALGTLAPRLQDPLKATAQGTATQNQSANIADLERSQFDLRHVGIVRDDKPIGTFDVEQLFARGTGGPELQAGDTLTMANKPVLIRVRGEVARPGFAFLDKDEPLTDALSQVGGLLPTASTSRIKVQSGPAGADQIVAQGNPRWNDPAKDVTAITVPIAPRVDVTGTVTRPGLVSLTTDDSLLAALYGAGGPEATANLKSVEVVQNGTHATYDVTKLVHGDMTQNPQLHDGDTVFVPLGHRVLSADIFGALGALGSAAFLFRPL
jgi:protein involved in polysaccharide export with SLBB domain